MHLRDASLAGLHLKFPNLFTTDRHKMRERDASSSQIRLIRQAQRFDPHISVVHSYLDRIAFRLHVDLVRLGPRVSVSTVPPWVRVTNAKLFAMRYHAVFNALG